VLKNHKSRNLKSGYYCSCINGRQRQATYDWMQGNYEWLELQCQLYTYIVSCSGLKKCKCFMPFCTAHQLRHILFCFVITEKIFIILSNKFIFKSSLCHTSCTVRWGTKPEKVKDPLVPGTLESQNSSIGKLLWETGVTYHGK
jgi:hypothetical protein